MCPRMVLQEVMVVGSGAEGELIGVVVLFGAKAMDRVYDKSCSLHNIEVLS